MCVKCEKPWQPADDGGADKGGAETRVDAASSRVRRSVCVVQPQAVATGPSGLPPSPQQEAPPTQAHAPSASPMLLLPLQPPPPPPREKLPAEATRPAQAGEDYGTSAAPAPVCPQSVRQWGDDQSEDVPLLFDDSRQVRTPTFGVCEPLTPGLEQVCGSRLFVIE